MDSSVLKELCSITTKIEDLVILIADDYHANFADYIEHEIQQTKHNSFDFSDEIEKTLRISLIESELEKTLHRSLFGKINEYLECVNALDEFYKENRYEFSDALDFGISDVVREKLWFCYESDEGIGLDDYLHSTCVFHIVTNKEAIIDSLRTIVKIAKKGNKNSENESFSQDQLITELVKVCTELQSEIIYFKKNLQNNRNHDIENARNREVKRALSHIGEKYNFVAYDQTQNGTSSSGKASGQIDILIKLENVVFTMIEALNLDDSCNKSYLEEHIQKLFKYDCSGNEQNTILVYADVNDFEQFFAKYKDCLQEFKSESLCLSYNELDSGYSCIKKISSIMSYGNRKMNVQHLLVRMGILEVIENETRPTVSEND